MTDYDPGYLARVDQEYAEACEEMNGLVASLKLGMAVSPNTPTMDHVGNLARQLPEMCNYSTTDMTVFFAIALIQLAQKS